MNKTKFYGCLGILALAGTMFTACSDDDNNGGNENSNTAVWTVNGGINACDHLLFTESDKAGSKEVNDNGTQIGNGDQEFVFTGKQTLKKGTYILKGWVYIADGAELTIEPGTVIKGDKDTKAALIAERGGKLIAQGSETEPIVFTSEQAPGSRRLATGVASSSAARLAQTPLNSRLKAVRAQSTVATTTTTTLVC